MSGKQWALIIAGILFITIIAGLFMYFVVYKQQLGRK